MENLEPYRIWLLMAAVGYVGFMLGRATKNGSSEDRMARVMRERENAETIFAALTPEVQMRVDEKIQARKTIEAIKIVREYSGAGLKEAKQAVDARRAALGKL